MTDNTTQPRLQPGDARWFFGTLAVIRATGADTDGAYTLLEVTAPPGLAAPLHVHHGEEEGFLVLDGEVRLEIGDDVIDAGPGDFALGPRGVPHRFEVGASGARMLWVLTPSGFEDMVAATSVPAASMTTPPEDVVPPADAPEIVARFGNEILA